MVTFALTQTRSQPTKLLVYEYEGPMGDKGPCEFLTIAGSPTRTERRCGKPTHEVNCEDHQRWLDRLDRHRDQTFEEA